MKHGLNFLRKYALLLLFVLLIYGLFVLDVITPVQARSDLENRSLAQRPEFSLSALVHNEYTSEYEKFTNDQFVGRDSWISVKSVAEWALGKQENNGVTYGKDGYLFPRLLDAAVVETRSNGTGFGGDGEEETTLTAVDTRQIARNINFISSFAEKCTADVTLTVVPNSYAVLTDLWPVGLENADQQAGIADIYAQAEQNGIRTIDLFDVMRQSASERQTYYRTDHHWTTDGAWAAYAAYCRAGGRQAVSLEELSPYRRETEQFFGTSFNSTKNWNALPDTLVWYDIPVTDFTVNGKHTVLDSAAREEIPVNGLYQTEKFDTRDKYAAFLYGNNGLSVIRSENNLNHVDGRISRILLIKDSYGNCLAPFLSYSYDEVYIVDLRSMADPISELIASVEFDDVWILYNYTTFQQDRDIARITF